MSDLTQENLLGGAGLDDAVYLAARKLVDSVESSVEVDPKLKHRSGSNVLSDAVKVDKCPPHLIGCNAAELFKATGGELTCPDLSMAPDPLIVDNKGRVCYAEKDILDHWMEMGGDGVAKLKNINIDSLIHKYSQELLQKFMDPANKKLLIAASQAARTGFNIPPIILNFYKYNPYVMKFCLNGSKAEQRTGASKHFRGLKQFSDDNNYAPYHTREMFATVVSNFTNSLEIDTGAEFMSVVMNPLVRNDDCVRGIFDIHVPLAGDQLDFLSIEPFSRSEPAPANVIHGVHANICELVFSGISAFHRDSMRGAKLQKLVNNLGAMLSFGELAPEYRDPEMKCRQGGVAAYNAIKFLPIVLKNWLANLPSTWRQTGPADTGGGAGTPGHSMQQRRAGTLPVVNAARRSAAATAFGSGEGGGNSSSSNPPSSVLQATAAALPPVTTALSPEAAAAAAALDEEEEASSGGGGSSTLTAAANAGRRTLGGGETLQAVETLQGGEAVDYQNKFTVDGQAVANPVAVLTGADTTAPTIHDPRLILQNFIALCFYLSWMETFAYNNSEDSIISLFKSLKVSYDAAMAARGNVEELLKIKAEEAAKRGDTNYKSAVTEKMVEDALSSKRGADASYLGTNVRIAKKLAKYLDIGWDRCKSNADLTGASSDLLQNSWADKYLPHQRTEGLPGGPYTIHQLPGLGHFGGPAGGANADCTDYPSSQGGNIDSYASNLIYQNITSSECLTYYGVNTREFRKAWKNTQIAYEGIKGKKNQMSRVGYQQLMSRVMDLHLTFCQSCESGRAYFLKMHEYSLMQTKKNGIPEDPRADTMLFDDPGHEISIYKQFAKTTKSLLAPLPDVNVCKVVVGESQYFVFKSEDRYTESKDALKGKAKRALEAMYAAYRNSSSNDEWYRYFLAMGNTEFTSSPDTRLTGAQRIELARFIIENSVEFEAVNTTNGRAGRNVLKMFGACEPLDTSDYYMFNRVKKTLDSDRPEDELFLLGIEGIAKYLNQDALFGRAFVPDPEYGSRRAPPARADTNLLPIKESANDTLRRKGMEGLNADERDWYARYIIFMTKASGGQPARLAQYLLETVNADSQLGANVFLAPLVFPFNEKAVRVPGRTLRDTIAMAVVWMTRNPAPLFASLGNLQGGDETLQGGEVQAEMQVEPVDAVEANVDYLLTGGLGQKRSVHPQFDPPRHIREALVVSRNSLLEEERLLDMKLQKQGRKPVVRYEVGEKCPTSLSKYNNLFGKPGGTEWVETQHPWVQCQEKMGFQFKTSKGGYCYPMDDKCYPSTDIKYRSETTLDKLQNFQAIANLKNSLDRDERLSALQRNRVAILADPKNENISHAELEEEAHRRLPARLRMIPDKVALQSMIAISEDVESQINEVSDSSDAEQRERLKRILTEHKLLQEQWSDPDPVIELKYLEDVVKDLVENAKLCASVSIAIKNQSSTADLKQNMRGALDYANNQAALNPQFFGSLPEDVQVSLSSQQLAQKCDVEPLYERDAVILPVGIKTRLPSDTTESRDIESTVRSDGLIGWWQKYHASTVERKSRQNQRLSKIIDPEKASGETTAHNREETLQRQLETALDKEGLGLLQKNEVRSRRHFRSRSKSRG